MDRNRLLRRLALLALAALLGAARSAPVAASPVITANVIPLGDGLWGFEVFVDADDGELASLFVDGPTPDTGLVFTGGIQQVLAFSTIQVDDEGNAAAFDSDPTAGYDRTLDSYYFEPWASNLQGIGIVGGAPGDGFYGIVAGTGPGSQFERLQLAYIVSSTGLEYEGSVSRLGQSFPVVGTLPVPEPATSALRATGLLSLVLVGRRR